MSAEIQGGSGDAERLSALADGEVDGIAAAAACDCWRGDAEMRRSWHAYHLIGDVLRSEDFASSEDRDGRFLVELRARLAAEPVVLAPSSPAAAGRFSSAGGFPGRDALAGAGDLRRRGRWLLPSAIAAGFMLVVGTFTLLRPVAVPPSNQPSVAIAQGGSEVAGASSLRQASAGQPLEAPARPVVAGKLVRDARLDRYLAAHKQFSGTSALGVPSAFLRSATVDAEPR